MATNETRPLTLGPTAGRAPAAAIKAEPLGDGPAAGVKLKHERGWCALGCGVFGVLFATGVLTALAASFGAAFGLDPMMAGGGVAAAGGLIVCGVLLYAVLVRTAVHPAEVAVAPWPLVPGRPAEVRFAQRLKKGLALRELTASLVCTESATYRIGTDSTTLTETRHEETLPPVDLRPEAGGFEPARQAVTAQWAFIPPADGPPSLEASNNRVTWELRIALVIDRHPDARCRFALRVV